MLLVLVDVVDCCGLGFGHTSASCTGGGPLRGPRKFNWELQNSLGNTAKGSY